MPFIGRTEELKNSISNTKNLVLQLLLFTVAAESGKVN